MHLELFCLGFVQHLECLALCVWQIWMYPVAVLALSQPLFHLLFLWDSDNTNIKSFAIIPYILEALFIFSSLVYFLIYCIVWVMSIVQSSSSLIISSISSFFF